MILRNNRKIAIIIPTYQAQHWLERCLTEVRQLILPIQYQLVTVVVDNASTDGTVEYLEKCSDIKFLPQTKNKGFAGANNIGLAWADHWGADYVFLLNQDVYCAPEVLTQLVDFLEIRPAAVAVQPQILGYPETELVNTLGGCLHCLGLGFSSQYQSPRQPAGIIKEISYVSGAACLYRLGHLKELGFFDERLFLYHEDLDCGWLSRLRGGQSFSLTTPIVYHHYKFSRNPAKYYYLERNRWLVLLQNYHWLTLLLLSPLLVAAELFLLVQAFKDGWLKQKLTAYGYFCSRANWRLIIDRRQFVQSLRKCPDYLVTATFCTNFNHTEVSNWVVNYLINPLVSLYWKLLQGLMFW